MATYSGSFASISIGGREFPVSEATHTIIDPGFVTDYTGPGWLAHFKEKRARRWTWEGEITMNPGALDDLRSALGVEP
jgi:hypothetical protein